MNLPNIYDLRSVFPKVVRGLLVLKFSQKSYIIDADKRRKYASDI